MDEFDLTKEEIDLLSEALSGSLTSNDVQIWLGNCSLSYANNILRKLWGLQFLSRKKIKKTNGGIKYQYYLSSLGEKVVGVFFQIR
jgi:predicted transcriptional regulator